MSARQFKRVPRASGTAWTQDTSKTFEAAVAEPMFWIKNAMNLSTASGVLWINALERGVEVRQALNDPNRKRRLPAVREFTGPIIYLLGMALENAAKAVIVQQTPTPPVKQTGKGTTLAFGTGSHALGQMLQKAGIALSPEETAAVDIASDYVLWMGRYHIPMTDGAYTAGARRGEISVEQIRLLRRLLRRVFYVACMVRVNGHSPKPGEKYEWPPPSTLATFVM